MEIHGKKLEQTNDGDGIYYDNIKITDKRTGLNDGYFFKDWITIISENKDFDPRKYHPDLFNLKSDGQKIHKLKIKTEKIENAFNYLIEKIWDLDDENFTVPNRLLESVEEAKQILLQEYDNESMNFHECSECNIRCNCTTAKCSCSCRTES